MSDVRIVNQNRLAKSGIVLPLALAVMAVVWRVYLGWGYHHKADALVVGTMAADIAAGRAFPAVYYGQHYMGSLEAWITAPLFVITGPTFWGIMFAPIFVTALGVLSFYHLGSALGGRFAGMAAAIMLALAPFSITYYTISPRGCYPEVIAGGAFLLWMASAILREEEKPGVKISMFAGAVAGLLLWTSLISVPALVTFALFAIAFAEGRKWLWSRSGAAFTAGSIPGVAIFLFFIAPKMASDSTSQAGVNNLAVKIQATLGIFTELFVTSNSSAPAAMKFLQWPSLAIVALSLAWLFALAAISRKEPEGRTALVISVFGVIFISMYMVNDNSLPGQLRYMAPLSAALFPAAGAMLGRIYNENRFVALAALLLMVSYWTIESQAIFNKAKKEDASFFAYTLRAYDDLAKAGVRSVVWSEPEVTALLDYITLTGRGNLHAMMSHGSRMKSTTLAIEADADEAVILEGPPVETLKQLETVCGKNYKTGLAAGRTFAYAMKPARIAPSESIPSSIIETTPLTASLFDRRFSTVYSGSGPIVIALKKPVKLAGLRAIWGENAPAIIGISASDDGVSWRTLAGRATLSYFVPSGGKIYQRVLMKLDREHQEWVFPEAPSLRYIRFDTDGGIAGPTYDIHEIFIYEASVPLNRPAEPSPDEVIAAAALSGVKILAVGRRMASLLNLSPGLPFKTVQPLLRPVDMNLAKGKWQIEPGFAAVVDGEDTEELKGRLNRSGVKYELKQVGSASLVKFAGQGKNVWWTGFTLIDY